MRLTNIAELHTADLYKKLNQLKTEKFINAILVGFTAGVLAVSIIKGGLGFASGMALIVAYFFIKNANKSNSLTKEMKRN